MNTTVVLMWAVVTISGFQFGNMGEVDARTGWSDTYKTQEECETKAKENNANFAAFKKIHRTSHCVPVKIERR